MTTLLATLAERREEFESHLELARAMEERLLDGDSISIGETALSVRHLRTIKSGLIVHLYNVVEALMSRSIDEVCSAVKAATPDVWSLNTLKEWLRFNASIGLDGNEESRLAVVHKAALKLLKIEPIEDLSFKKPPGTWNDKVISTFSKRLNVKLKLTPGVIARIRRDVKYGDKTPLEFLADRRNAIAHGRRTFEEGAGELPLSYIEELSSVTLEYMECVVAAFQSFVDERSYLMVKA